MGTYEHFCLMIFAQGKWGKSDADSIRGEIISLRQKIKEDVYHLYLKLTYRESIPLYSDCTLCQPIYRLLQEIKGTNDGLVYQGHHWIDSDDLENMRDLVSTLISNEKIKKFIFYMSIH